MKELGFSGLMGPKLRAYVEEQLVADLNWYLPKHQIYQRSDVHFDWSESCIEGHRTHWLDGEIENFSGIVVFNEDRNLIAEGWMEFIETEVGLEVFWWFLHFADQHETQGKDSNTVPGHVWSRLSADIRSLWRDYRPKTSLP